MTLRSPEFRERTYRAPTGGAIVILLSFRRGDAGHARQAPGIPSLLYEEETAQMRRKDNRKLARMSNARRSARRLQRELDIPKLPMTVYRRIPEYALPR